MKFGEIQNSKFWNSFHHLDRSIIHSIAFGTDLL